MSDSQVGWASQMALVAENLPAAQETWVQSLGWEDPWRRAGQPTPVFLPGESHGQRSLVGYSPWGHPQRVGAHTKRVGGC